MKNLLHYFKETELHLRKQEITEWGLMIRYALYNDYSHVQQTREDQGQRQIKEKILNRQFQDSEIAELKIFDRAIRGEEEYGF